MSTAASPVTIRVKRDDGRTRVFVEGVINEHADLSALAALSGDVEINLRRVRRINSVGVRDWTETFSKLSDQARLVFVECSPSVIQQANHIHGFLAGAPVRSFLAPMFCASCDADFEQLFRAADCTAGLPEAACPKCQQPAELDDLEALYLMFLREKTP